MNHFAVSRGYPPSLSTLLALAVVGCGAAPATEQPSPEGGAPVSTQVAAVQTGTVTLLPVADAYVTPDAPGSNFGLNTAWLVNRQYAEAYLKFDLSSLPSNAIITSVTFSALAYDGYAYGGDGNVYTSFVADDSWSETGITWNNRPAPSGTPSGEWFLWYNLTPEDKLGVNANPALIPVVQGELDGDKQLSFRLHSPGYKTRYRSREYSNANQRPKLVIQYELGDVVTVLEPEADARVSGSFWEHASNFGGSHELGIYYGWPETSFLRFNLGSIPPGAVIQSVKFSATATRGASPGGDGNTYTYLVPDNSWGEYSLTFDNQPALSGAPLGAWFLWFPGNASEPNEKVGVNDSPDLIPAVQGASDAIDRRISLRIFSPGYISYYHSREVEDASKRPHLEVTYTP
ncbi:DNRLRE domain-containing protein [Stigmatella sp. ncwal1]|uniref:DNRLRE domain-containing protein n=1 Tax=Stigmatella ashevillensis TaxID=2995309 RepID=A0ABT5DGE2_9BACT|nr:DNRLRE domain-containing protein [Stigmatella ashevillena]MDC0712740.1 DNRLRE domain-containing protein [Stigmatella ashevillena]